MRENKIGFISIATTFIGTLIGAGFASGQELMQFFGNYGIKGIMGTICVGISFAALAILIMQTARNMKCQSYEQVIVPNNNILRVLINGIITFFAAGILVVMIAGAGAMLNTLTGLPSIMGSIAMSVFVLITGWFGSEGMLTSFNIVVPIMMIIAFFTAVIGITNGADPVVMQPIIAATPTNNWVLSAMLFVSYNFAGAVAVLTPLGVMAKNRKNIVWGSIVGGTTLGLAATLLCIAIVKNFSLVKGQDIPLLLIAQNYNRYLAYAYSFVLFAGIFTTAAGFAFALIERLSQYKYKMLQNKRIMITVITIGALIGSNVGFITLVRVLYPINGYLGFIIIGCLSYNYRNSRHILR